MIFNWLFKSNDGHAAVLYAAIVAATRQPAFYRDMGVPDTVDGRFDLLVLHLSLVVARLSGEDNVLRQKLINCFCADMDGNIREMGTGDLGVAKKVRLMAEAFQGRYAVYVEAKNLIAMQSAVDRNVYDGGAPSTQLAAYALELRQSLATQSLSELLEKKPKFL